MGDGGHARVQNDPPPPLRMRTKIAARPLSVVVATETSFFGSERECGPTFLLRGLFLNTVRGASREQVRHRER